MQIFCLNETFRMISHSLLSNNVNLLKLDLSGYVENHVFGPLVLISPTISTCSLGKKFGGTRLYAEKK